MNKSRMLNQIQHFFKCIYDKSQYVWPIISIDGISVDTLINKRVEDQTIYWQLNHNKVRLVIFRSYFLK